MYKLFAVFWWKGAHEAVDRENGGSNSDLLNWDDLNSTKTKETYLAAAALSVLALAAAIFLALFLLFGLVIRGSRNGCERIFCGGTKWVAAVVTLGVIILIIVSWGLFISFPNALGESVLCPVSNTPVASCTDLAGDDLWCSSFAGMKKCHTAADDNATIVWTPFVGWAFAVISTVPAIVALLLVLFVRRYSDYEHIDTF